MDEINNGAGHDGATVIPMASTRYRPHPCVVIDFLPSRFGTGFQGSVTLDGTTNEISEIARGLHGFAALPSDQAMEQDPWMPIAVAGLKKQGVVFLSPDEVTEYMQEDGAYWTWNGNNGSSFPARIPHKQEIKNWKKLGPRLVFESRYERDLLKAKGSVLPMLMRTPESKSSFGKGSIAAALAIGVVGGFYAGVCVSDGRGPAFSEGTVVMKPVLPAG